MQGGKIMEYLDLAKLRFSCRKYTDEKVREEDLKRIILAANTAPVGSSRFDDIHLTIVKDRKVLDELAIAVQERFKDKETIAKIIGTVNGPEVPVKGKDDPFYHAPVVIFISHRKQDLQPGIEWANVSSVALSMQLEATSLGLGSCFMWGALEASRVLPKFDRTSLLDIPEDFEPLLGLAIGYPAIDLKEKALTDKKIKVNEI